MKPLGIENHLTEFKAELNDKLEREVVAFLNSEKGGDIFIGVENDGRVCGVADPDQEMLVISDRIKNNILPSCLGLFDVFTEEHDGKTVIHLVITRGTEKPYYLKKFGQSPAGCFLRVGSGVQQMTVPMIDQLYASRVRNSLRNIPAPTNRKLTFQQLKIYYQEKGFTINDTFLENLDLYTPTNQLNYVAYLLADQNSVSIKVAKYSGTDKCDLIENEELGFCSLIKATHLVLDKLEIENRTFTKITGAPERLQKRLIDRRALREALINAMVHNDYTHEVPPMVEIYADRLSITSYGGLVMGLSREEFFGGRSMPRNRELMRIYRDLDFVEQLGSGMNRILAAYSREVFKVSDHFLEVCFPFDKAYLEIYTRPNEPGQTIEAPVETPVTEQKGTKQAPSRHQVEIMRKCLLDSSLADLMVVTGRADRTKFRHQVMAPLVHAGLIELTQPDSPKSPTQKYRLTAKGRNFLEAMK